ncbi:MAG: sulfatase [Planctomycetaceae bacterium]|nr:sulfatase [Planctomycetaceae bacterium]
MNPSSEHQILTTRRRFFRNSAVGIGAAAIGSLLGRDLKANTSKTANLLPHVTPRAKRVIYIFMHGAPTHVDLFDFKPQLQAMHGQPVPQEFLGDKRFSTMTGDPRGKLMLAPVEPFRRHGQCGAWISDLLPYTASIADHLCFVNSMHTEQINHAPAVTFFMTGAETAGRPTMGAWLTYGLGTDTENLPAFTVMTSVNKDTTCGQIFYDYYWGSGFLPTRYQGVKFRGGGDPVLYLSTPDGMRREVRRGILDDLARLNHLQYDQFGDPEIVTRIAQYEMAYKMQASVPELTDISQEPAHVLDMYGPQVTERGTFAYNCLMARRLAERGVRFIQLMHAGWDQHHSLTTELYAQCRDTDQPSAALVKDLRQRGLLEDTLVIWGGEFGRTPFIQGDIKDRPRWGRDHHPYAFSIWMAGGGIQPGLTYGKSDDLAINVAQDPVHVHDFQATILHLLGIDHKQLTFKYQGRNFRLTDIHGNVVHPLLA